MDSLDISDDPLDDADQIIIDVSDGVCSACEIDGVPVIIVGQDWTLKNINNAIIVFRGFMKHVPALLFSKEEDRERYNKAVQQN